MVTHPPYVNSLLRIQRQVDVIYFDFGSVFDLVSHILLPRKLSSFRLAIAYVSWFRSRQTGRFPCIRISGVISAPFRLLSIVPAVLGPQFLGAFAKLRKATIGFVMSVRLSVRQSAWNAAPTRRIFMKFYTCGFLENLSRKSEFYYNRTRTKDTLCEDQYECFNHISFISS